MNIDVPLDDLVQSNADSTHGGGDAGHRGGGHARRPIVVRDLNTGEVHTVSKDGRQGGRQDGGGRRINTARYASRGGRRPIVVRDVETGETRTAGEPAGRHGGDSGHDRGDSRYQSGDRGYDVPEGRRHRTNPIVVRDPQTGSTRVLGEERRGGSTGGVRSGFISKRTPPRQSPTALPEPKILIGNLHHEVNNSDIYDLFSNAGPVARALVVYDRSGNHTGRGEVTFERYEHAVEAVKRYNGVPLDNRPLEIVLSGDSAPVRLTRTGRGPGKRFTVTEARGDDYDDDDHHGRSRYDRR
jgi:RNA recognition motif. (a.k.a. RRM, RBD, or RNP domain)